MWIVQPDSGTGQAARRAELMLPSGVINHAQTALPDEAAKK
jgi:hypothetical protein